MTLEGRVALVTGGARGIGAAICERLGADGVVVGVNYRRDADAAAATVERVRAGGGDAIAVQGDVGDPEALDAVVRTVRAELGPVTLLVNNAGYMRYLPPEQVDLERWRRFFRTNVEAAFLATWSVKDDMIAAGGGSIVNISSRAGVHARAETLGYGASKAALDHLTREAALALVSHGIRVNAVSPGLVLTDPARAMTPEWQEAMTAEIPMGRGAEPSEIAGVVRFLLSDEASYITGEVIAVAGGN